MKFRQYPHSGRSAGRACARTPAASRKSRRLAGLSRLALIATVTLLPGVVAAQNELRVVGTANPIQVLVSVSASNGTPIGGLTSGDFQLNEDSASQAITTVTATTNLPVSTVFVMDYSGSMKTAAAIVPMQQAIKGFIDLMDAGDEAAVIKFNGDIGVVISQGLTTDKAVLKAAVDTDPGGTRGTNLYDAIDKAIDVVSLSANTTGLRLLVVLTDGGDNASTLPLNSLSSKLATANLPVFTIGLGQDIDSNLLRDMADKTGGVYVSTLNTAELAAIYVQISERVNNEYLLTYHSAIGDCLIHSVQVLVATPDGAKAYDSDFTRCVALAATPVASASGRRGSMNPWELAAILSAGLLLMLARSAGLLSPGITSRRR